MLTVGRQGNKFEKIKLFQKINCFWGFVAVMAIQTIEISAQFR